MNCCSLSVDQHKRDKLLELPPKPSWVISIGHPSPQVLMVKNQKGLLMAWAEGGAK